MTPNDNATLAAALEKIRSIARDPDGSISEIALVATLALEEKCTPAVFVKSAEEWYYEHENEMREQDYYAELAFKHSQPDSAQ